MAEVVNQRLPRLGINVILAEDEVAAHVHFDDADLNRRSSTEFLQARFPFEPMDPIDNSLQLHRAFEHSRRRDRFRSAVSPDPLK